MTPIPIIIAGITASGKSELALDIANEIEGEIINADAMQCYKDLHLLTARPNNFETPHHLYGFQDAQNPINVYKWLELAENKITEVLKRGKTPIICGGSGFYIRALLEGISSLPTIPIEIRQEVQQDISEHGLIDMHEKIRGFDEASAKTISNNDSYRIARAHEVFKVSGKPLSNFKAKQSPRPFIKILICPERNEIKNKITARFNKIIKQGGLDEAKKLYDKTLAMQPDQEWPIIKSVGYRQLLPHLQGKETLEVSIQKAIIASHQYAKRQKTWFKNQFSADYSFDISYEDSNKTTFFEILFQNNEKFISFVSK